MPTDPLVTTDSAADADVMLHLLTGAWVAQIRRTTATLNIADHLAHGPATAAEVAERVWQRPAHDVPADARRGVARGAEPRR